MPPTAVSRRALLAAAAGAGVASFGGGVVGGVAGCASPSGSSTQPVRTFGDDDVELARRTAREATGLAAALAATTRRHRDLRRFLGPLQARHLEHLRAFAPDGEAEPDPQPDPRPDRVPASANEALRALIAAEQRATASTRRAAMSASSGDLASALASAAACLAQHQQLLGAALADRPDGG